MFLAVGAFGADKTPKQMLPDASGRVQVRYKDLGSSVYAPSVFEESINDFSHMTSTTVVKTSAGFLHTVTINTAAAQAFKIYNSTWIGDTSDMIASVKASTAEQTFVYDVNFDNGLTILCPASGPDITVSYR